MGIRTPNSLKQLSKFLQQGEGDQIEFKRSTGEMKEGMQTICAFLNGDGGIVLFGVSSDGKAEGQELSDQTYRDIAQAADRFEPPAHFSIDRIKVKGSREAIVLTVDEGADNRPFTYEGRSYERVGSTTRRMPQAKYERLLVERGHAKRRWENLPADGLSLKNLDRKEILRTRELAIQQNRISPDTSRSIGEILDRLDLRSAGVLTQAAQILYGKKFLPDYPQCHLKMGRFRGAEVTGEIVDNRQEHMNAFAMVREGMAFLERTMPLGARFPEGKIFREDRFPVPLDALREILLNAVMHRDYSHFSGHVAIAVFDDRIEIRSYGRLPTGITVEQLSGRHDSKPVNPLIAGAFHRTGAVEVWGRGTNRVIDLCKKHGATPPTFEEQQGFLIVTFKAPMVADNAADSSKRSSVPSSGQPESQPESRPESRPESLELRVLQLLKSQALGKVEISLQLGQKEVSGQLNKVMRGLVSQGLLQYTIPGKPTSRLQKYRLTPAGVKALKKQEGGNG